MALDTVAKTALKNALKTLADNQNTGLPVDEALDTFIDALKNYITSATVTVNPTGLIDGNSLPVTGTAQATIS